MATEAEVELKGIDEFEMDEKKEEPKDDADEKDIDWNKVYLFQDVIFRKSEAKDASNLISNIISPSFEQFVYEFKYSIPRKYRSDRNDIITSIFYKLIPYFIEANDNNYESYTFYNKNLDILIGYLLLNKQQNLSLLTLLSLLWQYVLFYIPYKIQVDSCWKLMQIHFAQKLIHSEFEKRLKNYEYFCIEMMCVLKKYHGNGYGSYMIQKIHQQIYGDDVLENKNEINKSLPMIITFTSTPHSIHLYQNNGYKLFIKVFIGVELTYYGFIYHGNKEYLHKVLQVFPNNYNIDLNIWNHMLPHTFSIINWILLILSLPFLILWFLLFLLINMIQDSL